MKKVLSALVFMVVATQSYSQIDEAFQKLLSVSFADEKTSKYIFTRAIVENGAAYVYLNSEFVYYATSFGKKEINLPQLRSDGKARIFDIENHEVYVFQRVIEFGSYTNSKVDTVILFDKIAFKGNNATLLFHTTNLSSSKWWNKESGSTQKFVKVKCDLAYNGAEWLVSKIKIKDFSFKAIAE